MESKFTDYGMEIGPMEVIFIGVFPTDRAVLQIKTPYKTIGIYCSATGRSLRAFESGKGEMTANESKDPA